MYNQLTFIFSKEQHGTILSTHLTISFVNEKNEKKNNRKLNVVNENYVFVSTVAKVLFFRSTDLYTVYLFSEYAGK